MPVLEAKVLPAIKRLRLNAEVTGQTSMSADLAGRFLSGKVPGTLAQCAPAIADRQSLSADLTD
jgi:hypothetical protein